MVCWVRVRTSTVADTCSGPEIRTRSARLPPEHLAHPAGCPPSPPASFGRSAAGEHDRQAAVGKLLPATSARNAVSVSLQAVSVQVACRLSLRITWGLEVRQAGPPLLGARIRVLRRPLFRTLGWTPPRASSPRPRSVPRGHRPGSRRMTGLSPGASDEHEPRVGVALVRHGVLASLGLWAVLRATSAHLL